MTPPIDIFAIAATRLSAAQDAFHGTFAMQASPFATVAYHRALLAMQIAELDMYAVQQFVLALSR